MILKQYQFNIKKAVKQYQIDIVSLNQNGEVFKMNGYNLMAAMYREDLKSEDAELVKVAEKKIKVYEFLATCDKDDLCNLIDSSAFNDLIKGYIEHFLKKSAIDSEAKELALVELHRFKIKEAKSILDDYICR